MLDLGFSLAACISASWTGGSLCTALGSVFVIDSGSGAGVDLVVSGEGFFSSDDGAGDPFPRDRSEDSPSEGFCGLLPAANRSRNDNGAPLVGSFDGVPGPLSPLGVVAVVAGVDDPEDAFSFSPSFCFRLAASAANLDTFPPAASCAPPSSPMRRYNGSIRISALRCAGTLSQGESRKNSAAEKWAWVVDEDIGGKGDGRGNTGTGNTC